MSLLLSLRQPQAVHIIADAAAYRPDGRVTRLMNKVRPISGTRGVFSVLGTDVLIDDLDAEFGRLSSSPGWGFDAAVAALPDLIAGLVERHIREGYGPAEVLGFQRVDIAGWSDREGGPVGLTYQHASHGAERPLMEAARARGASTIAVNELVPWPFGMQVTPVPDLAALSRSGWNPPLPALMDPMRDALPLAIAARSVRFDGVEGSPFRIGGWLDLATVDECGVRVRTVHRWRNDRVGHVINPGQEGNRATRRKRAASVGGGAWAAA